MTAEFHGILPSLSEVWFAEGLGGMGWRELGGRWQKLVRTPLESPRPHTKACGTLIGHRDLQSAVGIVLGPHCQIGNLHWCHCSSCYYGGLEKMPSRKVRRPVNIQHLIHWGWIDIEYIGRMG